MAKINLTTMLELELMTTHRCSSQVEFLRLYLTEKHMKYKPLS